MQGKRGCYLIPDGRYRVAQSFGGNLWQSNLRHKFIWLVAIWKRCSYPGYCYCCLPSIFPVCFFPVLRYQAEVGNGFGNTLWAGRGESQSHLHGWRVHALPASRVKSGGVYGCSLLSSTLHWNRNQLLGFSPKNSKGFFSCVSIWWSCSGAEVSCALSLPLSLPLPLPPSLPPSLTHRHTDVTVTWREEIRQESVLKRARCHTPWTTS